LRRRAFTLVGPDVALLAQAADRPNNAVFVAECDGLLDVALVRQACAELATIAPFMGARLRRPFPWGPLRWVVDDTPTVPVAYRRLAPGVDVCGVVEDELNATIDPWRGPVLRWSVIDNADGSRAWLALTWVHPLMDPRGAELIMAMLDAMTRGAEGRQWAASQLVLPPREGRSLRERLPLARRAVDRLREVAAPAPRSLGSDVRTPGRVRYRHRSIPTFSTRTLPVTLALAGAAVAPLFRARRLPMAETFLVPVAVDRRRKGEAGPVFGNYLSFHFARLSAAHIGDVGATARAIRGEITDALRSDAIEGMWVGMGIGRYYPPGWILSRFEGELASFNYADTGEVRPACTTLFGAPVCAAYHVPCVQPKPGLGIFLSRAAGRESIVVVWVDRVVHEDEVDAVLANLEAALQGSDAA
jgi:hypothetical protein